MIQKILDHKARNGVFAFLFGFIMVVGALYMDVIRGQSTSTIGLYQIVGALIGYTISGIGVVMVMKETDLRKTLQTILFYSGGLIAIISIFADYIGVAGAKGFDKFQITGITAGLFLTAIGLFVYPQRFSPTNE